MIIFVSATVIAQSISSETLQYFRVFTTLDSFVVFMITWVSLFLFFRKTMFRFSCFHNTMPNRHLYWQNTKFLTVKFTWNLRRLRFLTGKVNIFKWLNSRETYLPNNHFFITFSLFNSFVNIYIYIKSLTFLYNAWTNKITTMF